MKISSKGRYAITAMINLTVEDNHRPVTLTEISKCQGISLSYLEQLFSLLRKSGLVQGVRGPGGGYRLGKTPNLISIADIINAVEEHPDHSDKNHWDSETENENLTNQMWNELSDTFMSFLSNITLAKLIQDKVVQKTQFQLDETTRRISSMFPVSSSIKVA